MSQIPVIFVAALIMSFIGSVPLGMINMAVANTAMQKGMRAGVFMGMGASFVELFQVFIALKFTWLFEEGGDFADIVRLGAILVFFSAGTYFLFFAKHKTPVGEIKTDGKKRHEFLKGIGLSSMNLMVIPYWTFYGSWMVANGWLERNNETVVVFSIGAMFGAFLLLVIYAYLGERVLRKSETLTWWANKFIGAMMVGLGVYQCFSG